MYGITGTLQKHANPARAHFQEQHATEVTLFNIPTQPILVDSYDYSLFDGVANVVGGNGDPGAYVLSILAAPTLFIREPLRPHTGPHKTAVRHPGNKGDKSDPAQ